MILADTTVWIDHFRSDNKELRRQLAKLNIVMHPFIVAELALGSLQEAYEDTCMAGPIAAAKCGANQ